MLFTIGMKRKISYSLLALAVILFSIWRFVSPDEKNEEFSEVVKIALREVGNQLLLSNQDSTSLVLPVLSLKESKYKLSFQKELSIEPNTLVSIVEKSFSKSSLPKRYRVEVIQCTDEEVAYSYEMKNETEKNIIPCSGRFLPEACYIVELRFTKRVASIFGKQTLLYILIFIVFLFLLEFLLYKRKQKIIPEETNEIFEAIGSFQFYPEQNKLVKAATEISLSKKECELLAIFVAKPNQVIKRDELMKKVWEDNGVFVCRSLDTYISKLRKKLKEDDAIKLTNVHGVGYKLEIK